LPAVVSMMAVGFAAVAVAGFAAVWGFDAWVPALLCPNADIASKIVPRIAIPVRMSAP
jgi:hypothetical protein